MGGARALIEILGQFIPVFPPIILSFDSPKTSRYSHNLVPIISFAVCTCTRLNIIFTPVIPELFRIPDSLHYLIIPKIFPE